MNKKKAYAKVKGMFADYIRADRDGLQFVAEMYKSEYSGACRLYEEIFGEEFILTDEDRHEILGVTVDECQDFIEGIFRDKNCKGIETECFWKMAEKVGLWKRGTYGSAMSEALKMLTKVVSHHDEDGNWIYNTFDLA